MCENSSAVFRGLYISIYIYVCVYVCVCVCLDSQETNWRKEIKHYHTQVISKKLIAVQ